MGEKVKIGVVGLGNIGHTHVGYLKEMNNVEIVGVCDHIKEKADSFAAMTGAAAYYDHIDMLEKSGPRRIEAIIISTPHYDHVPISINAFERGVHVLVEKPITVHVNGAKKIIEAYEKAKIKYPKLIFGIMFNERMFPHYMKIKDLIDKGDLGKITRCTWINTQWFRSQAYYDSGGWRATWAGEGGGILTNQCPHNLDTYHWYFGLPEKIHGFAYLGKYHNIEVEDEVTACMEHSNGMTSQFIVSTAECPGTNRLEIVGEHGTLVYENRKLVLYKNRQSMFEYSNTTKSGFERVETWETNIPINYNIPHGHRTVTEKFVKSIITGEEDLVAHGREGLNPVMIANAIMLSSFQEKIVKLPMNGDTFEDRLNELIKNSRFVKSVGNQIADFK